MQERLRDLRDFVQARNCKQYRHDVVHALRKDFKKKKFNINRQLVELLRYMCNEEKPTVFKDEKIGFLRTTANSPYFIHSKSISREYGIPKTYFWDFGNVCLNWEKLLNEGLLFQKEKVFYV